MNKVKLDKKRVKSIKSKAQGIKNQFSASDIPPGRGSRGIFNIFRLVQDLIALILEIIDLFDDGEEGEQTDGKKEKIKKT